MLAFLSYRHCDMWFSIIIIFLASQAYIDFEISEGEYERTRQLYERLLDRTKHLKVWISYAKFEASAGGEDEETDGEVLEENDIHNEERQRKRIERSRGVFEKAFDYFRTSAPELKEERAMLLEDWLNTESSCGSLGDVSLVQKKLPRKVKKRRPISSEDGTPAGYAAYPSIFTTLKICWFLLLVTFEFELTER
ncbi:hypothetical protein BHE74_00046569 [Ensete ventricosum]|nr:hypothetical protein BHE74_00046569 [Ensete ventricosum]